MPATTDATVLALVRIALGTALPTDEIAPVDEIVARRAARLGVLEQVIEAAAVMGMTDAAAAVTTPALRARALQGVQAETTAWRTQQLLADAAVPSLLLKGVALAAMTGRGAGERVGVDTDVLVRPGDWPLAHEALVAAGYRLDPSVPVPRMADSSTQFVTFTSYEAPYRGTGGVIDLHWRLVPGHLSSLTAAALLERAVDVHLAGATAATLDRDAMLAHVALHGAKDRWRSARTLVDAHLLVTVAGARWSAAATLVGPSSAVADLEAAVGSTISEAEPVRAVQFDTEWVRESPVALLRHRVALTPNPTSFAAIAAGMLLPRQVVADSSVPHRRWWLLVAPRVGRAMVSGFGVVSTGGERPAASSPASAPHSKPRRALRDVSHAARDLAGWYAGSSSGADTYRVARKLHMRTAGVSSAVLSSVMRVVPGATDHVRRVEVRRALDRAGVPVDELRADGFAMLRPALDDDAVARLREFAAHAPAKLHLADGRVVDGTYADRHPDTVLVFIPGVFAWANGDVQHVMASERLQDLVSARFGLAPVVHTPSIYWSCQNPARGAARGALGRAVRFHSDYDGVDAIRVHIYLTRVDETAAPLEYVRGSHRVGSLRGVRFRRPDLGLDEDVVVERFGTSATRLVTGPAGTTFVTDPRGLHRATNPEARDRLFLVMGIRAGAFAGAVRRRRAVPVHDEDFRRLLDTPNGPLRLFEAIPGDGSTGTRTVQAARLA